MSIPVIANGDIFNLEQAEELRAAKLNGTSLPRKTKENKIQKRELKGGSQLMKMNRSDGSQGIVGEPSPVPGLRVHASWLSLGLAHRCHPARLHLPRDFQTSHYFHVLQHPLSSWYVVCLCCCCCFASLGTHGCLEKKELLWLNTTPSLIDFFGKRMELDVLLVFIYILLVVNSHAGGNAIEYCQSKLATQ